MGFGDAVRSGLRKWNDFQTRASRSEYWWFSLFNALALIAASVLVLMAE